MAALKALFRAIPAPEMRCHFIAGFSDEFVRRHECSTFAYTSSSSRSPTGDHSTQIQVLLFPLTQNRSGEGGGDRWVSFNNCTWYIRKGQQEGHCDNHDLLKQARIPIELMACGHGASCRKQESKIGACGSIGRLPPQLTLSPLSVIRESQPFQIAFWRIHSNAAIIVVICFARPLWWSFDEFAKIWVEGCGDSIECDDQR